MQQIGILCSRLGFCAADCNPCAADCNPCAADCDFVGVNGIDRDTVVGGFKSDR